MQPRHCIHVRTQSAGRSDDVSSLHGTERDRVRTMQKKTCIVSALETEVYSRSSPYASLVLIFYQLSLCVYVCPYVCVHARVLDALPSDVCVHEQVADWKQAEGEKIYASSKREPLGSSWAPNGIQELVGDKHQFGVKIGATEMNKNPQAKRLIYPAGGENGVGDDVDPEAYHDQYVKTHGQYYPGEQRQRGYNWDAAGIDKDTHAFGIAEKHPYYDGVSKALNPLRDTENHKASVKVVSKRQEDFKLATAEELGRCKHQGFGDANVSEGHVYGVPSRRFEEWDVGKLIASQQDGKGIETADRDLGLSLQPGFRNRAPEDRVFGAPTIRTDIPGRDVKSVADNNNYGNEPDAMSLVYPSTAAHRGVVDRDYVKPYHAEELKELMEKAGVELDAAAFDEVFEMGSEMEGNAGGAKVCSVSSFRNALRAVRRRELGI